MASFLTGGAALLSQSRVAAAVAPAGSPNGDVRIAIIGLHGKGNNHIDDFRKVEGVKIAALCDVDSEVLAMRAQAFEQRGEKVATYRDVRKLLDDSSIDAVVIATPNHWHSLMTVWACQAGKDVYVEKPISHNVWEGRKAVEAARKYNRIVQAGTQSRSAEEYQQLMAYIRAGNIGKIQWVRGLCYKSRESIGKTSGPQAVPASIDYDLWSGPAPLVPPRRNSPKFGTVHYDWHWFWNYGGGDIGNQGIHQMDLCRWALGEEGLPSSVMSIGGRFGYDDDAETPNSLISVFNYESAPLIFEVRGLPRTAGGSAMDAYRGTRVGLVIQCEGGYFSGGGGGGFIYDNDGKRMQPFSGTGGGGHQANFIAAVRSRKQSDLTAPIEGGHISSALCHLGNISYRLGADRSTDAIKDAVQAHEPTKDSVARLLEHLEANQVATETTSAVMGPSLELASDTESFVTDEKYDLGYWANTMLKSKYRKPFVVPEKV